MILNMVNSMLDLAKIETINFKLVDEFFDLAQTIDDACLTMQPSVVLGKIQLDSKLNVNLDDAAAKVIKRKLDRPMMNSTTQLRELLALEDCSLDVDDELDEQLNSDLSQQELRQLFSSVKGDKMRYMQIFFNFLSNSIKFTSIGKKVQLRATIIDL